MAARCAWAQPRMKLFPHAPGQPSPHKCQWEPRKCNTRSFVAHHRGHMSDPAQRAQAVQMISGCLPKDAAAVPTPFRKRSKPNLALPVVQLNPKRPKVQDQGAAAETRGPESNIHPAAAPPLSRLKLTFAARWDAVAMEMRLVSLDHANMFVSNVRNDLVVHLCRVCLGPCMRMATHVRVCVGLSCVCVCVFDSCCLLPQGLHVWSVARHSTITSTLRHVCARTRACGRGRGRGCACARVCEYHTR